MEGHAVGIAADRGGLAQAIGAVGQVDRRAARAWVRQRVQIAGRVVGTREGVVGARVIEALGRARFGSRLKSKALTCQPKQRVQI